MTNDAPRGPDARAALAVFRRMPGHLLRPTEVTLLAGLGSFRRGIHTRRRLARRGCVERRVVAGRDFYRYLPNDGDAR